MKILSIAFCLLFILVQPGLSVAQNHPSVQEKGVRTPSGVKIDGKATELNNVFEAYNKKTNIFYTLTNDGENFYLVIQSTNIGINNKILNCGITFTVNPSGKKNKTDAMSITYPEITQSYLTSRRKVSTGLMYGKNDDNGSKNPKKEKELTSRELDSVTNLRHRSYLAYLKEIGVSGIKEIKSPRISIYNDNGIAAKLGIDDRKVLTYELSVPLKYFGLNASSPKEIAYEIALNDSSALWGGNAPPPLTIQGNPRGLGGMDIRLMDSRMSFWGLYTLMK